MPENYFLEPLDAKSEYFKCINSHIVTKNVLFLLLQLYIHNKICFDRTTNRLNGNK